MNEDIVTLEVAKKLRDLGFPQEFEGYFTYYTGKKMTCRCTYSDNTELEEGTLFNLAEEGWCDNTMEEDDFILAPTHALTMKWLRKEKHLHVCLDYLCDEKYSACVYVPEKGYIDTEGSWAYEEAEKIGIEKALELLEK